MTQVLIVDDHAETRRALAALLRVSGVQVCGEAQNGREALAKVEDLQPDLVVLDLVMPEMNGLYAASEIRRVAPEIMIVLISIHFTQNFGLAMLQALGADAYVEKSAANTELVPTIALLARTNGVSRDRERRRRMQSGVSNDLDEG